MVAEMEIDDEESWDVKFEEAGKKLSRNYGYGSYRYGADEDGTLRTRESSEGDVATTERFPSKDLKTAIHSMHPKLSHKSLNMKRRALLDDDDEDDDESDERIDGDDGKGMPVGRWTLHKSREPEEFREKTSDELCDMLLKMGGPDWKKARYVRKKIIDKIMEMRKRVRRRKIKVSVADDVMDKVRGAADEQLLEESFIAKRTLLQFLFDIGGPDWREKIRTSRWVIVRRIREMIGPRGSSGEPYRRLSFSSGKTDDDDDCDIYDDDDSETGTYDKSHSRTRTPSPDPLPLHVPPARASLDGTLGGPLHRLGRPNDMHYDSRHDDHETRVEAAGVGPVHLAAYPHHNNHHHHRRPGPYDHQSIMTATAYLSSTARHAHPLADWVLDRPHSNPEDKAQPYRPALEQSHSTHSTHDRDHTMHDGASRRGSGEMQNLSAVSTTTKLGRRPSPQVAVAPNASMALTVSQGPDFYSNDLAVSTGDKCDVASFLSTLGLASLRPLFAHFGVDMPCILSRRFTEHFLVVVMKVRATDAFRILDARDDLLSDNRRNLVQRS